eukprot:TRINITY_DN91704_c0_g1_i1.p1 TRINITY_DN91704_c0_g1~~TRINITY_DN91704_c0_g1_i1.p1  ORF type:complete len:961 (+),score=178.16 TRINITY_DN91704_c0_g1_i1:29-2911(+)
MRLTDAAAWLVLFLSAGRELTAVAAGGCHIDPLSLRTSFEIQGSAFHSAYELSLEAGLKCLQEVKSPWGAVNQSLLAISDFYEQFYAFRRICRDPAASVQKQAYPFDVGVFGSERGGGTPPEDAGVDLIGDVRRLAHSFEEGLPVSVAEWYMPVNNIFNRLRDAHVNWRNGRTRVDKVLDQVIFTLQDGTSKRTVQLRVSADNSSNSSMHDVVPDGTAAPIVVYQGKAVKTIEGLTPMLWLRKTILENSAFNFPYKSLGARANHMLALSKIGFAWLASDIGSFSGSSKISPQCEVIFEDGSTTTWQWVWLLLTKNLDKCPMADGECYASFLSGSLEKPSTLFASAREAWTDLSEQSIPAGHNDDDFGDLVDLQSRRLTSKEIPQLANEHMTSLLREQAGLRHLLGIAEAHVPGTDAHSRSMLENSNATEAKLIGRRWLLDPKDSRQHASYGYFEARLDSEGEPYIVMKLTRLYLTDAESGGFDWKPGFLKWWKELVQVAQEQRITRLLVDVSGNSGGYVSFAYLLVRAIFPEDAFTKVCQEYDRPRDTLYESWATIPRMQLLEFLNDTAAIKQRMAQLTPEEVQNMSATTARLTKAGIALDLLESSEMELLQATIDSLDGVEALDMKSLKETISKLTHATDDLGNPFALALGGYTADGKEFDPYDATVYFSRGGYPNVPFTAKFRVEDCARVFTKDMIEALDGVENPFQEILFLTDGLCGSSCDTATRTAYLLSKELDRTNAPRINFIAFGGLGGSADEAKTTLSATSFPGGNVMGSPMGLVYNPVLEVALFGYLAAEWAGLQDVMLAIERFRQKVPQYPFYWNNLPKYSQSELYQNELGQDSLPAEYYFFPTDFYLPQWYYDVTGMPKQWNETELQEMHDAAAKAFTPKAVLASMREQSLGNTLLQQAGTAGGSLVGTLLLVGATLILCTALVYFGFAHRRRYYKVPPACEDAASSDSA